MRRSLALALLLGLAMPASAGAGAIPEAERKSGSAFMSEDTRDLEADEALNPATLWVQEGAALWSAPAGSSGKACADCHGDAARSMAGAAARHPTLDPQGRLVTLSARIAQCRTERQGAAAPARESLEALALEAYVARQSRGLPITTGTDPGLAPEIEAGRKLFETRMGQLSLSCADCHDAHWGRRLGGAPIPQAHPTAYPIYRLEWQTLGSLRRRLDNCTTGVRAAPLDDVEAARLELYLMTRARGMTFEAPGVRP